MNNRADRVRRMLLYRVIAEVTSYNYKSHPYELGSIDALRGRVGLILQQECSGRVDDDSVFVQLYNSRFDRRIRRISVSVSGKRSDFVIPWPPLADGDEEVLVISMRFIPDNMRFVPDNE